MRKLYFVTHPEVVIDPDLPAPRWPLSVRGKDRMRQLLRQPWARQIGTIYSSYEQKAVDGAKILADELDLSITKMKALGEIDRSSTGYLPFDEFMGVYAEFLANPTTSIKGWEVGVDAQRRIVEAVDAVVESAKHDAGHIAIVAHGAVGLLYLCHVKQCPISIADEQPGSGGGNYFSVDAGSRLLVNDWLPIEPN